MNDVLIQQTTTATIIDNYYYIFIK